MRNIYFDIETLGLKPIESQITSICAKAEIMPFKKTSILEKEILNSFKHWLTYYPPRDYQFVSKNGKMFDVPYILIRGLLKGVDMGDILKYNHVDLQEITKGRVSLDDMAKLYGIGKKSGNGLKAIEWFNNGELDKVEDYCWDDVVLTEKIYLQWRKLNE